MMDPIGFGLERFDGIGRIRDTDSGAPIDDTGELIGGATFEGAVELAGLVAADPRFELCVSEQLLTYALGRGMRVEDEVWIHAVTERARENGGSLRDVILEVVLSPPFRDRTREVSP
jgi:hypothetical protein